MAAANHEDKRMHVRQRLVYLVRPTLFSLVVFFRFFGNVCCNAYDVVRGKIPLTFANLLATTYRSGVSLLVPLVVISFLLGISTALNLYRLLSPFNFQHEIIISSQRVLIYDFLPFLIGLMLSIQMALNLITARIKKLKLHPNEVVNIYIIPIMIAVNFSALFLYIYVINVVFISIYFWMRFLLGVEVYEYFFHIKHAVTSQALLFAFLKVFFYCTLVSLIVGYYYYGVAIGFLSIRRAISRIITRSFFWLALTSVYFEFFSH